MKNKNYNIKALDIANYLIEYYNEVLEKPINNLKLQKLLYYIQAMWITEKNEELFEESIEKWKYGPVVAPVYFEFRHYGKNSIKSPLSELIIKDGRMYFEEFDKYKINLSEEEFSKIHNVATKYQDVNPFTLVEQTHNEPMWNNFKREILSGKKNLPYTFQEIKKYYSEKEDKPWN